MHPLLGIGVSSLALVSATLVLAGAAWVPMLWCRLPCPTGAVLDALTVAGTAAAPSRKEVTSAG